MSQVSSPRCLLLAFALACVAGVAPASPVNVNTADAATIASELKGIGLKRAQAIVEYRTKHGPFRSADELSLVKGIGRKAIDRNRNDIRLDGGKPTGAAAGSAQSVAQKKPAAAPAR